MVRTTPVVCIVAALPPMILSGLAITAAPALAQASVPAGPPRCLRWNRVIEKQGYYDNSRVEITNSCRQPVYGWQCVVAVYGPGGTGCDPRFGGFSAVTYAAGQMRQIGIAASANPLVDLRECPAGMRPAGPLGCQR